MATMQRRKERSKLNSGATPIVATPLKILSVARTDEISTGMQMGKSRKERSRVFPSENITSPETKEPANERSMAPRRKTSKKSGSLSDILRFRNTMEEGSSTYSTSKSNAIE